MENEQIINKSFVQVSIEKKIGDLCAEIQLLGLAVEAYGIKCGKIPGAKLRWDPERVKDAIDDAAIAMGNVAFEVQ